MADRKVEKAQADFMAARSVKAKDGTAGYGVYEVAYELKFGATTGGNTTITTTDNGLIKTVATLPAKCTVLDAAMVTTEAFDSTDEKGMDLVITSTTPSAADTAITGDVVQLITAFEAKSNANGALGQGQGLVGNPNFVDGGDGTHLCLINTDGSNTADAIQTGKIVVYIKYIGSAAPVANTDV
tara:strand:- start:218 stop:769 length:552 start_codon:yes stop_codon:yes gene_type:complete